MILLFLLGFGVPIQAQTENQVNWITFEQLDDSLARNPKNVFIDFYTDWCIYCKKMDRVVFTRQEVSDLLNSEYYAVRFDAESTERVEFGGRIFENDQVGKSRTPLHQLAQLLATRDETFTPPVMLVFDDQFNLKARYFEYMDSRSLIKALSEPSK
jgi:thioredoxin-related protein